MLTNELPTYFPKKNLGQNKSNKTDKTLEDFMEKILNNETTSRRSSRQEALRQDNAKEQKADFPYYHFNFKTGEIKTNDPIHGPNFMYLAMVLKYFAVAGAFYICLKNIKK